MKLACADWEGRPCGIGTWKRRGHGLGRYLLKTLLDSEWLLQGGLEGDERVYQRRLGVADAVVTCSGQYEVKRVRA